MSFHFNPKRGLVIVRCDVRGPLGSAILRLALDTGATNTLISTGLLMTIGCDPAASLERVEVTTGSGVEFAPKVKLVQLDALGYTRADFPVLAHTLPPSARIDGLLGLDFLRGQSLTLDFRIGEIMLA
jgi:predicted aspartyl protease